MKTRKGTPKKIPNVKKLRKLFETETSISVSTSSPTRGRVELLPQLCKGLTTNLNPSTTKRCARLWMTFCVDQPGGGTQTGPRQDKHVGFPLDPDWLSQARLGLEDQLSQDRDV